MTVGMSPYNTRSGYGTTLIQSELRLALGAPALLTSELSTHRRVGSQTVSIPSATTLENEQISTICGKGYSTCVWNTRHRLGTGGYTW